MIFSKCNAEAWDNIIIHGLPEINKETYQSTEQLVKSFMKENLKMDEARGRSHQFLQSAPDWACRHIQAEKSSHRGKSPWHKDENVHHDAGAGCFTPSWQRRGKWQKGPSCHRQTLHRREALQQLRNHLLAWWRRCNFEPVKFQLGAVCSCKQSHTSVGSFANESVRTNDSLKWMNWPRLPLSFTSFVVVRLIRWRAADSRRWFASRSLTVIDSRTETSWLPRASQMHAVFVFSVSCQINKIFECLVNLSRSFMARSHARDPGREGPPTLVDLDLEWGWPMAIFTIVNKICPE